MTGLTLVSDVICPVCGTLCDDIEVTVEGNNIIDVRNACSVGTSKFLGYNRHRVKKPLVRTNGQLEEVSLDEAIRKSAEILCNASYPILYGWSCTSCEASRAGLELAEEVGGVIDNTSTVCHGPSILSIQDIGIPTCTLGQIRHRADLIVYWGCNPHSAHPRHMERYSMFVDGRFQRSGYRKYLRRLSAKLTWKRFLSAARLALRRPVSPQKETGTGLPMSLRDEDRKLVVVDVRKSDTAEMADYFIQVEPGKDYELLQALRVLVRDEELDVDEVAGVPVSLLEEVADVLINCRFGILFFGLGLTMSEGKHRNIDAALSLTRDLNSRTKFLIMPMRGHYNVAGANVVFTWQSGYAFAVDYSKGYPYYNPGETSVVDILSRGENDASLVVASDPVSNFPRKAVEHLVKNPLIVIDPGESPTTLMADVVIPSAFIGLEAEGTAYRMDRVPLHMRKVVDPPEGVLEDQEILRRILLEVKSLKEAQ